MVTVVVAVLVCFTPGAILGLAIPPGRDRWIAWAASPILTLGLVAFALSWLARAGVPDGALWILGVEFVIAVVAVVGSWLVARRHAASNAAGPVAASRVVAAPAVATKSADAKVLAFGLAAAGDAVEADDGIGPSLSRISGAEPIEKPDMAGETVDERMTWRSWLRWGTGRPKLIELIAVGVPSLIAVAFGRLFLHPLAVPPGVDAMNHGLLTRNILRSGSTAVSSACTTGPTVPASACHFYPLGIDVQWAQISLLSGAHISRAMLAWSESVGPLALVIAIYAAVRAFGGRPVVAGCASLVPVLASPMFVSMLSGRPPEAFAPGFSVAIAVLAALAVRGTHPVRFGLLAGVGTAGLIMAHTYEILFAATLTVAFLFVRPVSMALRKVLAAVGAIALATLISVEPVARGLLGADGERAANNPPFVGRFGHAWQYWVTSPQGYVLWGQSQYGGGQPLAAAPIRIALIVTLACLFASPLCLVFKQLRWARPWLLTWIVWTAIGLWTSTSDSGAAVFVNGLWYGVLARVRTMVLPLHGVLVVAGAYAIGLAVHRLVTTLVRRGRDLRIAAISATAMAGLVVVGLVGLGAMPSARVSLAADLKSRTFHGAAYPRVFNWLAEHTSPGKTVAYDRHAQFMTWSYADYGVLPLFGISPLLTASKPNYDDRWTAWDWLVNSPGSPRSGCLVRKYGIQYVVVGSQRMPGYRLDYNPTRLAGSPNVTLVHRDGGIKVYQVNGAGEACTSA